MIWNSDAERADAIQRGADQYRYQWARTLRDTADRHEVPMDRRAALGEWLRAQALADLSAFDHLGRWMEERTAAWATETWVEPVWVEPRLSLWVRVRAWWYGVSPTYLDWLKAEHKRAPLHRPTFWRRFLSWWRG